MEKIEIFCTTRINNSQILVKAVDGDGVILKNIFDNSEEEIRFLGIDAPEIKQCLSCSFKLISPQTPSSKYL